MKYLSVTLLITALATWLWSVFVPIYGDELIVAISGSRAWLDDWRIGGVWIRCQNNFNSPVPLLLMPGRALAGLIYLPLSTPLLTRLSGMLVFMIWGVSLAWASKKCLANDVPLYRMLAVVVSISFLGLLPFMAVLTRPETHIAVAITAYAFLPYFLRTTQISQKQYALLCGAFLLLSSWFFSVHPKTLFFTPLVAYAFYSLRRPGNAWNIGAALLALMSVQGLGYWNFRMACPDNQSMQDYINLHGLQVELLRTQPLLFIVRFFHDLAASLVLVRQILFMPSTTWSYWLPTVQEVSGRIIVNLMIMSSIVSVIAFWVVAFARGIAHTRDTKAFCAPNFVVPLLLLQGIVTTLGFQGDTYFYNAEIWLIGCCLTMLLFYGTPLSESLLRMRGHMFKGLAIVSLISQISLLGTYRVMPELYDKADKENRWDVQELASPLLDYNERITNFAQQCHIDPIQKNSHLVVDRFTYFAFFHALHPIYIEQGYMEDSQQPLEYFMKEQDSAGLVAVCSFLPEHLKAMSLRDNNLCCISKDMLFMKPPAIK